MDMGSGCGWKQPLPLSVQGLVGALTVMKMGCTSGNDLAIKIFNQGLENSKLKQFDKAIADYTKAIELDPKLATAYSNRGIAYGGLKQYNKTITDCTGEFTLEVQRLKMFTKYLGRCFKSKTFPWSCIEFASECLDVLVIEAIWFCIPGDKSPDASIHIFD
jgi:hypothetical protein